MKNFNERITSLCSKKNNRLCLGLDIDNSKLKNTSLNYMEDFIIDIINSTIDLCPIYKINFAFYERHGSRGYKILENINNIICGRAITIADAKRGDIGNSSRYYADAIFNYFNFDSVTLSPYMGSDSLSPFADFKDKGVFVLCLTSNPGSKNIQKQVCNNIPIYISVIKMALEINKNNNIGLVIGATNQKELKDIKKYSKTLPWLMPGVGFQGGNLKESLKVGEYHNSGLAIINVSRGILTFGSKSNEYGSIEDIRKGVKFYTDEIRSIL